jgi:hypothetical protein
MPLADYLKSFDSLPDDALLPPKPAALLLGISMRTLRRTPPVRKVAVTAQRFGYRVGDIRKLVRGELAPQSA